MPQPAAGLGRAKRLSGALQFRRVFKCKTSVYGKYFAIHSAGNTESCPRLGLSVTKKVTKKAVQRNRIKRQIRDSFRLNQHLLGPVDVVVIARPNAAQAPNSTLRTELERLWTKFVQQP